MTDREIDDVNGNIKYHTAQYNNLAKKTNSDAFSVREKAGIERHAEQLQEYARMKGKNLSRADALQKATKWNQTRFEYREAAKHQSRIKELKKKRTSLLARRPKK